MSLTIVARTPYYVAQKAFASLPKFQKTAQQVNLQFSRGMFTAPRSPHIFISKSVEQLKNEAEDKLYEAQYGEAAKIFAQILRIHPTDLDARNMLSRSLQAKREGGFPGGT